MSFLTAVQSQEFGPAKWALGERCRDTTDAAIQQAFDDGHILRTHILRPTWHFIAPSDIRWILQLTTPHLKRMNARYLRQEGLDARTVHRCHDIFASTLTGGTYQTRRDLHALLTVHGIEMTSFQLGFVVMEAEFDALICSGPMRGKQHTYALLDERVSNGHDLRGDDALGELARRYFTSHGPSTDREFARWSGLNLAQARRGLAFAASHLASAEIAGQTHWFEPDAPAPSADTRQAFLLHEYDEAYLSYLTINFPDLPVQDVPITLPNNFYRPAIIDRHRVGFWRREIVRKTIAIELLLFAPLQPAQQRLLDEEVARFGAFHDLPASITSTSYFPN